MFDEVECAERECGVNCTLPDNCTCACSYRAVNPGATAPGYHVHVPYRVFAAESLLV